MTSRREETTARLRRAAFDEFVDRGPRALTFQGVARRGYYSVGAVTQRWPTSSDLLHELVDYEVLPRAQSLADEASAQGSIDAWLLIALENPTCRRTLLAVAELLFAARDDPALIAAAQRAIWLLRERVPAVSTDDALNSGLRWYFTVVSLGTVLLEHCGCRIQPLAQRLSTLTHALLNRRGATCAQATSAATPVTAPTLAPTSPVVPDDTARALVQAGRDLIASEGARSATTRAISERAGVTTGALYRRYPDRDTLLRDVFAAGLSPERYAWAQELVDALVFTPDPQRAADILVAAMRRTWTDTASAHFLLELSMAAHESDAVRTTIAAEVHKAQAGRRELFTAVDASGVATMPLDADVLAWLLQVAPVGARLAAAVGVVPTDDELRALLGLFPLLFAHPVPDAEDAST